jgi:hypothetical protein
MATNRTFKGTLKPFGKSGHFNESMRHSLQARGYRTGIQYKGKLIGVKKFANGYKAQILPMGNSSYYPSRKEVVEASKKEIDAHLDREKRLNESYKIKFDKPTIFYYKIIKSTHLVNGGQYETAEIWQHTPSGMDKVGETKWNTASYKGRESEVLLRLKKIARIPEGMFIDDYYHWGDAERHNVKIVEL